MRTILIVMILAAASIAAYSQPTGGGANQKDEQAIRKLMDDLSAALVKGDVGALGSIYADDYAIVNDNGTVTPKAARLAAIKSGDLKYDSLNFSDANIRFYGNTAVATWISTSKGMTNGQPVGGQFRVTSIWVKSKGRWQSVAAHITRIGGQ